MELKHTKKDKLLIAAYLHLGLCLCKFLKPNIHIMPSMTSCDIMHCSNLSIVVELLAIREDKATCPHTHVVLEKG